MLCNQRSWNSVLQHAQVCDTLSFNLCTTANKNNSIFSVYEIVFTKTGAVSLKLRQLLWRQWNAWCILAGVHDIYCPVSYRIRCQIFNTSLQMLRNQPTSRCTQHILRKFYKFFTKLHGITAQNRTVPVFTCVLTTDLALFIHAIRIGVAVRTMKTYGAVDL